MTLAIDIGNTFVKFGVFDDAEKLHTGYSSGLELSFYKRVALSIGITKVIISPLVGADNRQFEVFRDMDILVFSEKTPVPVDNKYETPKTLGRDRLAGIVGARSLYPDQNCLVIDAGTCITFDLIHKDGRYDGGSIHPGVKMRLQAMHHFTDSLPLVSGLDRPPLVGRSTTEALRCGAINGVIQEIMGMIEAYEQAIGPMRVILTGGDHKILGKHLEKGIFVYADLVLRGLNEILRYNEN